MKALQHIVRDMKRESAFRARLFVIGSFPRSGSHWTRRMLAEVISLRYGISVELGQGLDAVAGFQQLVSSELWRQFDGPVFVASHQFLYDPSFYRVYLRRKFDDVLRSTRKVEKELAGCWWGGTDQEVYRKWSEHVARGCREADLVIDYETTRLSPDTTIRSIYKLAGIDLTNEEVARAVLAGRRSRMLKEQDTHMRNRQWDIINKEEVFA